MLSERRLATYVSKRPDLKRILYILRFFEA